MNEKQMQAIEQALNNSEMFKSLNESIKALYIKENREPTAEEYEALRTILICKVMLDDEAVHQIVSDEVWNALQA